MKRIKTEQEREFLRDVERLLLIIHDAKFVSDSINLANAYEKVVEFFRLANSIATKKVYMTLPLNGRGIWGIKLPSLKDAEMKKKLFVESIHEILSSDHNSGGSDISGDTLFFGEPRTSVSECNHVLNLTDNRPLSETENRILDPDFQGKTRQEIVEFVKSFKGKLPLDWIRK